MPNSFVGHYVVLTITVSGPLLVKLFGFWLNNLLKHKGGIIIGIHLGLNVETFTVLTSHIWPFIVVLSPVCINILNCFQCITPLPKMLQLQIGPSGKT